ncbi:uncharacterized protein LOC132803604 [Ziziphus jujuba]|uniref:Uncharacterized protein LOC132803604 n=1 Tax=Ziziphus jujuba TaxID=326968 RepID=A0ABM4A7X0_ZIZJJ|nr:uncharacterized protein LOC132803604 [Ziziphus jujuba]
MASGGSKRDPAWEYGFPIEGNKSGTICKYCNRVMKSGGVTRLKYHLSGIDPSHNVQPCGQVPPEVKKFIIDLLKGKQQRKIKKANRMEEIRADLRGQLHAETYDVDDEDDDDIAYPPGMDPYEKNDYREAIHASKQSKWERSHLHKVRYQAERGECSSRAKLDHKYIYEQLKKIISEVGKKNVVQIVTDNGSAFVKAGKKLMGDYNLYWTPCAAHCIDLMFEDIGKNENVAIVIKQARAITTYIYNHNWLLAKMRETCKGDIIRPGLTRFATNYLALDSLVKKKAGLKQLFTSIDWTNHNYSASKEGQTVENIVLNHTFWDQAHKVYQLFKSLYKFLRIVDTEVYPTMGAVYELMRIVKEELDKMHGAKWILKIINNRPGIGEDSNLVKAVHDVYTTLDPKSAAISHLHTSRMQEKDLQDQQQLLIEKRCLLLNGGSCTVIVHLQ